MSQKYELPKGHKLTVEYCGDDDVRVFNSIEDAADDILQQNEDGQKIYDICELDRNLKYVKNLVVRFSVAIEPL